MFFSTSHHLSLLFVKIYTFKLKFQYPCPFPGKEPSCHLFFPNLSLWRNWDCKKSCHPLQFFSLSFFFSSNLTDGTYPKQREFIPKAPDNLLELEMNHTATFFFQIPSFCMYIAPVYYNQAAPKHCIFQ